MQNQIIDSKEFLMMRFLVILLILFSSSCINRQIILKHKIISTCLCFNNGNYFILVDSLDYFETVKKIDKSSIENIKQHLKDKQNSSDTIYIDDISIIKGSKVEKQTMNKLFKQKKINIIDKRNLKKIDKIFMMFKKEIGRREQIFLDKQNNNLIYKINKYKRGIQIDRVPL